MKKLNIQIRGTSGTGKSTIVREVMEHFGEWTPFYIEGRQKPLYCRNKKNPGLVVIGHYETTCGGCDTIGSAPKVFETMQEIEYDTSISEGLLWGEDVKWTLQLKGDTIAYFLTTELEECIRRVKQRQGGRIPADPERVIRKLTKRIDPIESARRRLIVAGTLCRRVSCAQCKRAIIRVLSRRT